MKIILLSVFISINLTVFAQQWEWAVTADSVYGNQETKMICKSDNDVYALIYQYGPSIINNTYLDSGSVIVKINSIGQIVWAKHYPSIIQSIYAENDGTLYFVGIFSDSLNFPGTSLISHGGKDIFYGQLDASGNSMWISSAGGFLDDSGNGIMTDKEGNIFMTGRIKDDYFVGTESHKGNSGLNFYLLRCDLAGNYIAAYADTTGTTSIGWDLQKDIYGTLFFSSTYGTSPCPYICGGTNIIKINPLDYTLKAVAEFNAYSYEYLYSWAVNNDSTTAADYNTCSHYMSCSDIYNVSATNHRTFRKGLGNGYNGEFGSVLTKGISDEIIVGGPFTNDYAYGLIDTLWFDSFFIIPDSLPNVVIGGVDTSNQFTWLLHSEGKSSPDISALISNGNGSMYCGGNYNNQHYWLPQVPSPVTFGNIILPSENYWSRFYVAGAGPALVTNVARPEISSACLVYPNPSSGIFTIHFTNKSINTRIGVFDLLGNCVLDKIAAKNDQEEMNLTGVSKGVYFIKLQTGEKVVTQKILVQ